MHNLLNFFIRHSSVLLLILLEVLACYFIFTHNSYQRSKFFNSSNIAVGKLYETSSQVNSYFGLKNENQNLLVANGQLKNRIASLEDYIFELTKDSVLVNAYLLPKYNIDNEYIVARIIKNSINLNKNYITINKGKRDSVNVGMAVISTEGAVGEIVAASDNFAIIQPLLNTNSNYSCKLQNSNAFGPFLWDGKDSKYVTMKDFPSYEEVHIGDTVVTSGYSDVFPSDVLIGTVKEINLDENANDYDLTIELSTNFNTLKNVLIVKRDYLKELQNLENSIKNVKN